MLGVRQVGGVGHRGGVMGRVGYKKSEECMGLEGENA